jgi:hypothetical protein
MFIRDSIVAYHAHVCGALFLNVSSFNLLHVSYLLKRKLSDSLCSGALECNEFLLNFVNKVDVFCLSIFLLLNFDAKVKGEPAMCTHFQLI